ncbi:DUF192 domain-containing protein [Streptomyces buecherae]|uniref:DUF192 domain-containing protein n=1 Tax=Streptomyces buecherae TaxID=2763006 RepID=UPI003680D775
MGRWRDGRGTLRVPRVREGAAPPGGGREAAEPRAAGPGAAPARSELEVPLEIAASYRARSRGLLGRTGIAGALLLSPASGVHTFRMRFAIDVAYLDRELTVIAVRTMRPGRLGLPRPRARHVLEAEAGTMERWGLRPGVRVSVGAPAGRGTPATAGGSSP